MDESIRKEERSKIKNLSFHIEKLGKEEQIQKEEEGKAEGRKGTFQPFGFRPKSEDSKQVGDAVNLRSGCPLKTEALPKCRKCV